MKKCITFVFTAFMAFLLISCSGKWEDLFNGKDLTGWIIHGTEKWYVEDGLLICEKAVPTKNTGTFPLKSSMMILKWKLNFCRKPTATAEYFSVPPLMAPR